MTKYVIVGPMNDKSGATAEVSCGSTSILFYSIADAEEVILALDDAGIGMDFTVEPIEVKESGV